MSYTLEELARDIETVLRSDQTPAGKQAVCEHVSRALSDDEFVATHLKDRADDAHARQVLYEHPELGFCICSHVYQGQADTPPHDHGPTWAIYGQAAGQTTMSDWRIDKPGAGEDPSLVSHVETYVLNRGDARYFAPGAVHSLKRNGTVRLVRIEGANLDRIQRSKIAMA